MPRQYFRQIMPELPVPHVPTAVTYYHDILGFEINYQNPEFAVLDRDQARILLIPRTGQYGIGSCYIYIRNANALYEEYTAKGVDVQGPPVRQPWGLHEFILRDPDGNRITFGRPFEPENE